MWATPRPAGSGGCEGATDGYLRGLGDGGWAGSSDAVRITLAACGGRWDRCVDVLRARVARQCLEAGLLDEILLCVAGVILGDGFRLFDCPGGSCVRLERLSLSRAPLATNAGYPSSAEPSPPAVPS